MQDTVSTTASAEHRHALSQSQLDGSGRGERHASHRQCPHAPQMMESVGEPPLPAPPAAGTDAESKSGGDDKGLPPSVDECVGGDEPMSRLVDAEDFLQMPPNDNGWLITVVGEGREEDSLCLPTPSRPPLPAPAERTGGRLVIVAATGVVAD